jgi:hypothetical protein
LKVGRVASETVQVVKIESTGSRLQTNIYEATVMLIVNSHIAPFS